MAQAAKASSARSSELRWLSLLSNKDGYGTAVPIIMGQIGAPHRSNRERIANNGSSPKLESNNIKLVLAARPLSMPSDRCWRLGMIVYELVTNAARHAFNGAEGEIWVELWPIGDFVECRVSDSGIASHNVQRGRGLYIVEELVKRLDGKLKQRFGSLGSTSIIVFPN